MDLSDYPRRIQTNLAHVLELASFHVLPADLEQLKKYCITYSQIYNYEFEDLIHPADLLTSSFNFARSGYITNTWVNEELIPNTTCWYINKSIFSRGP